MSFRTVATDCHVGALPLLAMTETESPRILSLRGAERRGNPSPNSYLITPNSYLPKGGSI